MREMEKQKAQAKAAGALETQDWKAWERTKGAMRRDARALDAKSQVLLESAQAEVLRTAQVGTLVLQRHPVPHLAEQQECSLNSKFDERCESGNTVKRVWAAEPYSSRPHVLCLFRPHDVHAGGDDDMCGSGQQCPAGQHPLQGRGSGRGQPGH